MIDHRIHEAGEAIEVPRRHAEAAAWRIAAELVRRHPDDLVVIEMHPGMGQYDCVAVCRREYDANTVNYTTLLMMNLKPHGHIDVNVNASPGDARPNWLDAILSTDIRRDMVIPIERSRGLILPKETPSTTARSIGIRLIAEMLTSRAHRGRAFTALNGVHDSSGMGGSHVRSHLFSQVAGLDGELPSHHAGDVLREPAYRYWFLLREGGDRIPPEITIDTWSGLVWTKSIVAGDLMKMYDANGRDVSRLASLVQAA